MFLALENGGVFTKFGSQVSFVLHQVVQPWHPQGGYVHEVALAVRTAAPEKYVAFVKAVMVAYSSQKKFTDEDTWEKTRSQIYDDLLAISDSVGAPHGKVSAILSNTGAGTGATQARAVAPPAATCACATRGCRRRRRSSGRRSSTACAASTSRPPPSSMDRRARPREGRGGSGPAGRRAHVAAARPLHLGVISA